MGLFDFLKNRFIQVITWNENEVQGLVHRFPHSHSISRNTQLVVSESQVALLVKDGEIIEIFEPGKHSPHQTQTDSSLSTTEIYFFSTREQINQRWGTATPIIIPGAGHQTIPLRAHGTYSYRIKNPRVFFRKLSGTLAQFNNELLEGQLRALILTSLGAFFGQSQVTFANMSAHQEEYSKKLKELLTQPFLEYGLRLESFYLQSISVPPEFELKNEDPYTHLNKLHELLTKGVITQIEFDTKKAEILKKLS